MKNMIKLFIIKKKKIFIKSRTKIIFYLKNYHEQRTGLQLIKIILQYINEKKYCIPNITK